VTSRRRAAAGLLVVGGLGFPVAWSADAYIFGFAVLGLVPLQLAVAGIGVLARLARLERSSVVGWLVDGLLVAVAAAALTAVRSILWA
jgi:hypothetical protein